MSGSRTHWKKPPTRVYDYNYNLGEHYYKPQLRHAELKSHGRASSPPKAKTFAERFAEDPVYGNYGGPSYRSPAGRKTSLTDELFGNRGKPSGDRFDGLGDSDFSSNRPKFSDDEFSRPKFSFGDRLLDAMGGNNMRGASPRRVGFETASPRVMDDPFEDPFFQGRRAGRGPLTADSEFMSEDPFKNRGRADEMMEDMQSSASKFRAKLRAKKAAQEEVSSSSGLNLDFGEDDNGTTESRIEKIRQRARARIAEAMEDDIPPPPSNFSKSGRGVAFVDDFDNSGTSGGMSKSVRISKRSVKTSYDDE